MAGPDASIFGGPSPWTMWGNTQLLELQPNAFTNPRIFEKQITLLRVQYNRPETWRFLFTAKLLAGTPTAVGENADLAIWFELFTGIGRSAIRIPFWVNLPNYNWSGGLAVPIGIVNWTNQAATSDFQTSGDLVYSDEITGQDISVVAHANFVTDVVGAVNAQVEISGQFAPNSHVRPDWFQVDAPPAEQFSGGELKGR